MNQKEEANYNPMDKDEASEGLPHLRESQLPVEGVAQMNEHWAIRGENARKKFYSLWVECKKIT